MTHIKALSEDLQKIAIEELCEVPSRVSEDLQALKQWIESQPHLNACTDDQFLIQFLRGCKFSLERTKEKIDMFFSIKSKYPELFGVSDVDNLKFRETQNLGVFTSLPKPLNGNGPRIAVVQFNYSTSQYGIEDIFLPWTAVHEIMIVNDPYACINGLVYIIDFAKASASHFLQLTPNICKSMVSFLEKSMPLRIKKVIYINVSVLAQQFFKMLFPFFSDKLRQRITVLGSDPKELTKHIPLDYLPADYGGPNSSCTQAAKDFNKALDMYREYFKQNAEFGTDETLRAGKPLDWDGLFGVGGSFRKLNVD